MQDVASEFTKIFRGRYPPTFTAGGRGSDPVPLSCTQHSTRPLTWRGEQALRCWDPNLAHPPQLFSRGCAPGCGQHKLDVCSPAKSTDINWTTTICILRARSISVEQSPSVTIASVNTFSSGAIAAFQRVRGLLQ